MDERDFERFIVMGKKQALLELMVKIQKEINSISKELESWDETSN